MLQIVLLAGKFILLLILYLFIYRVVRSTTRELRMSGTLPSRASNYRLPEVGHVSPASQVSGQYVPTPPYAGAASAGATGGYSGMVAPPAATWRLVVTKSPTLQVGEAFAFPAGSSAVIGRASEMDIHLDDTFVSSKHAVVEAVGGGFRLEDLHSTNGTLVNGEPVEGTRELRTGDTVELGDTVFRVEAR